MATDRNTSIRSDQILKHTLQQDDLSPDALVWQEPVEDKDLTTPPSSGLAEGDRYIIASGTWDKLDEDCAGIDDWNEDIVGDGESTQVTFDSKSCFKFDTNTASPSNRVLREKIIGGGIPDNYTIELNLYNNAINDAGNCFLMDVYNGIIQFQVHFRLEGLFIYGDSWQEVGTNLVQIGTWQKWRFEVRGGNAETATVDVYLDDVLQTTNIDCSNANAGGDGTVWLQLKGNDYDNRIAHVDYVKVATETWKEHTNQIAHYHTSQWNYYTPIEGWFVWINDENKLYRFDGSSWAEFEAGISASEWNQNGFENKTDSTLTWTDSTPDRTLSIQPTSTSFDYYIVGIKYTSTGDTVQITDVEGVHYIYYDGDTLTAIANPSFLNRISIIETKALVSVIYWNATANEGIYIGEERHGKSMSPLTHSYLHFTEGLRYIDGLGLNTLSIDQDGDDNEDTQFGVDSGSIADEDLFLSISSITSTIGLPIYYMTGATPIWNKTINTGYSVIKTGTGGEDRLAYNQYTGGSWQLTEVSDVDFVLCHIFATTEKDKPMIAIVGQNIYTNKPKAQTGALTEIRELILNDILFPEIRPIATVIFQTDETYNNTMKARVISTADGDDYIDWRNEVFSRVELSTSEHNALTGKQGGTTDEYYHLKSSEHTSVVKTTTGITINGGGEVIETGYKGFIRIPYACTITKVTLLSEESGSIVIDIWKDTYANYPPTDADSITASAPPTISSTDKSEDSTLSGWTTAISADDILAFNVDSITDITKVVLILEITKI